MTSYSTQELKYLVDKFEIVNNKCKKNITYTNMNTITYNNMNNITCDITLEKTKEDLINYIIKNVKSTTNVENGNNYLCFIVSYLLYKDEINNNKIYETLLISLFSEDEINKIKIKQTISRNDYTFKKELKQLYNICQVTGCHISCCDVAHILEFKDCTTNVDRYNKYNGLLLKGDIHRFWDLGYIKLNFDNTNNDNCSIFFTINKEKINHQLDNHNLLFNVIDELKLSDENAKCYLYFHKEYFNDYKYYIARRNDYL